MPVDPPASPLCYDPAMETPENDEADGAGRMQLNGRILSTQRVERHSLGTKTRVRRYIGHECQLS